MEYEELYGQVISEFKSKTPNSMKEFETAKKYLAEGETRSVAYYEPYPFTVDHAKGARLYDIDGNKYIDFINNYTSLIHGHAHPVITEAIKKAAERGLCAPAGIHEQVELAEMLCNRIEGLDTVRFCNSGTEATMFALRVARAYTGKDGVAKILGGYHGTTDPFEYSCVSVTKEQIAKAGKWEAIPDSAGISKNVGKDIYPIPYNNLDAVEELLREKSDELACLIAEPFMGSAGVIPPKEGYLKGLRELTEKYHVLLILDEVQSLRMSTGGSQKKYGVVPDLSTYGKIIGGGLPVGAFGGKREIMKVFDRSKTGFLTQSGTFNGNRATMAAGIKSLELADEKALNYIEDLAIRLENGFNKEIQKQNVPVCTTREGSLVNVHFQKDKPYDYETSLNDNKKLLKVFFLSMVNQGIFPACRGLFVMSTVMTEQDIDKAIEAFAHSIEILKPFMEY